MEIKILQVFYGKDGLPYKDKDRQVHFPIAGTGFLGASNTTKIKFYYDELDNLDETTWVAVSKLPNGKVGSRVLESYLDEELNEHYALLELDNYYTQYKGDVFISLQGYQGGVDFDYDEENSQYEIHGTPTIAATGSIKFTINYANQFVGSGETDNINFQRILAALGTKLGMRAYSEYVEELPSEGSPDVFYVIKDDPNHPNLANIYVWNQNTRHYIWVGDNTLDLGNYYTQEQGEQFESGIDNRVASVENELSSVTSGAPSGVFADVSALTTAYPTGNNKIYVCLDTGDWYYWNSTNSEWTSGGTYLSTGDAVPETRTIAGNTLEQDISADELMSDFGIVWAKNLIDTTDTDNVVENQYWAGYNNVANANGYARISIPVIKGHHYSVNGQIDKDFSWFFGPNAHGYQSHEYFKLNTSASCVLISGSSWRMALRDFVAPYDGFLHITSRNDMLSTICCVEGGKIEQYHPYNEKIERVLLGQEVGTQGGPKIYVRKDGKGDFIKLVDAINYAIQFKDSYVYVGEGTWDIIEELGSDYFDSIDASSTENSGIILTNGIHLIFDANSYVVCNYTGNNQYVKYKFSPFVVDKLKHTGYTIENLNLVAKNVRYCIHDDTGGQIAPYTNVYKNCHLTIDNRNNDVWQNESCIGGGLGCASTIIIKDCYFDCSITSGWHPSAVGYHNCTNNHTPCKSIIVIDGCYFANAGTAICQHYGNHTDMSLFFICNCELSIAPYLGYVDQATYPNPNFVMVSFNNKVRENANETINGNLTVTGQLNGKSNPNLNDCYSHSIVALGSTSYPARITFNFINTTSTEYNTTTFKSYAKSLMDNGNILNINGWVQDVANNRMLQLYTCLKEWDNEYRMEGIDPITQTRYKVVFDDVIDGTNGVVYKDSVIKAN